MITGTEEALAKKRLEKKKEVFDFWRKKGTELSEDDKRAMMLQAETADSKAILDHIRDNLQIIILPAAAGLQTTTGPSAPTGPPSTPIPLPPGSLK